MYKSMFRPELIRRDELCFFRPCKTSILASDVRNPPRGYLAERSTSVYINLVRCVYHCFTFSLVLGMSPIAIVVCLINILICSPEVTRVNFHLTLTHTDSLSLTLTRSWSLAYGHSHSHSLTHTHSHVIIHAHSLTPTHTYSHTHIHSHSHRHTHTHT